MNRVATLLWCCVALFAVRVIGQVEALLVAPPWLPDMDSWYSGLLPYHLLLPAQIVILMLMAVIASSRRVRSGAFARANPRVADTLRLLAPIYFLVMAVRLVMNIAANGPDFWREGAIPVAFHWVLALFVLVSARASAVVGSVWIPAQQRYQHDEADDVPHGDIPALPKPLAYGLGFREKVGHGDAR